MWILTKWGAGILQTSKKKEIIQYVQIKITCKLSPVTYHHNFKVCFIAFACQYDFCSDYQKTKELPDTNQDRLA